MSAAPAVSSAAAPTPRAAAVLESQFKLRQHANADWTWIAPHGITREQLLDPACWANVAKQLAIFDTIVVIPQSGEFRAELIVTETGTAMARVRLLRWNMLVDDEEQSRAADYAKVDQDMDVKWCGPNAKWCVDRRSDKHRIFRDLVTKDEAYSRALEYMTG